MEAKKDTKGKLNYELDFEFIKGMAERMEFYKEKYEPYNWQKPMDIEQIDNAITRHLMEIRTGNLDDDGQKLGHYYALACNAMIAVYQLKNHDKKTVEVEIKDYTIAVGVVKNKNEKPDDIVYAKKGDRVIITDSGEADIVNFTLNKEYILKEDYLSYKAFLVELDDYGSKINGYDNPLSIGMKFKKLSKNEYYINRQRFVHDDGEGWPLEIVSLIENESLIKGKRYNAYKKDVGKYKKGCSFFTITTESMLDIHQLKEYKGKERFFIVTKRENA